MIQLILICYVNESKDAKQRKEQLMISSILFLCRIVCLLSREDNY